VTNSLIEKLGSATTEGVLSSAGVREEMRFFLKGEELQLCMEVVLRSCKRAWKTRVIWCHGLIPWEKIQGVERGFCIVSSTHTMIHESQDSEMVCFTVEKPRE
jgi:hypothetical protein